MYTTTELDGDIISSLPNFTPSKYVCYLDRDGVVIGYVPYLTHFDQVHISEEAIRGLKMLADQKNDLIVVTNQSVIARGVVSANEIIKLHEAIAETLYKRGVTIHAWLTCPHTEKAEIRVYRRQCSWRKPHGGMILEATKRWKYKLSESCIIGDMDRDILSGQDAGVGTTILLNNTSPKDPLFSSTPTFCAESLAEAAQYIETQRRNAQ